MNFDNRYGYFVISSFIFLLLLTNCKNEKRTNVEKLPMPIVEVKKDTIEKPYRIKPLIIIDAGHGGEDPGAVNDSLKLYEKNITRKIVDGILNNIDTQKVTVIQTRPKDLNIHRHTRIDTANKYWPDLLLTVHINYDKDTTINGFEMAYNDSILHHANSTDTINQNNPYKSQLYKYSNLFNKKIAINFPKMRIRNINVRKDRIWMIYAGNYPSLLMEFGFISNRKDLTELVNKKSLQKLSKAIVKGLYTILDEQKAKPL
jgi:N-acetylmuramoyl-L-alanine amidase